MRRYSDSALPLLAGAAIALLVRAALLCSAAGVGGVAMH
jgi:hypothetical protein